MRRLSLGLVVIVLALSASATTQEPSASIVDLLDAYAAGHYARAIATGASWASLGDLRKAYPKIARAWIDRAPAQTRQRRLVAAGLILEIVKERYERDWTAWPELRDLIEWSCEELRREAPSESERAWHRAAVALAGRTNDWVWLAAVNPPLGAGRLSRPAAKANHVLHAWRRFPSDSFFLVAKALTLAHQHDANSDVDYRADRITSRAVDRGVVMSETKAGKPAAQRSSRAAIAEFGPVLDASDWSARARAHVANLYLLMHEYDAALTNARQAAQEARDTRSRYLAGVIAGMALEKLGRVGEAHETYLDALRIFPGQSAALRASATGGNAESSAAISKSSEESLDARLNDPYQLINYGMYMYWPVVIEAFRGTLQ